jgi:hypothetical protein
MRATTILVPLLVFLSGAGSAAAQDLTLEFREGLVRLTATNVPANRILDEWTRVGGTRIVNAESVPGAPLTLLLIDVPERQALDTVLRGAAGYMVAARQTPVARASAFDTIFVLPTTMRVLATSSATPQRQQTARPIPIPPPQGPIDDAVEDDDEPEPDEQVPTSGLNPPANAPSRELIDDAVEDDDEPPDTSAPAPPAPRKPSGVTPGGARPVVPPPPASRDRKGVLPSIPR